jgi:hypothetical protein
MKYTFRGNAKCINQRMMMVTHRRTLKHIVIPPSVTQIDKNSFSHCENIDLIDIPDSVTSIGEFAFESCSNLKSIKIPRDVTAISKHMFSRCTRLKLCFLSEKTRIIGYSAFRDCRALVSIVIPNSVEKIEMWAFYGCSSLVYAYIPPTLTDVYHKRFDGYLQGCPSLKYIVAGHNLEYVPYTSKMTLTVGMCRTYGTRLPQANSIVCFMLVMQKYKLPLELVECIIDTTLNELALYIINNDLLY